MREENFDDWADIETGGAHSKSIKKVASSDRNRKKHTNNYYKDLRAGGDGFDGKYGNGYSSFFAKSYIDFIKRCGKLMTKKETSEMMDNLKKLSDNDIIKVYSFMDDDDKLTVIGKELTEYMKKFND